MKSLLDKKILVTKEKAEAEKSLDLLIHEGAEIIYFPTIKIIPIGESESIKNFVSKFDTYDFIILTSANAVEVFVGIARENDLCLNKKKIAVAGKATAARCLEHNIIFNLVPDEFSAKGLIKKFSQINIAGRKILIPGSSLSHNELGQGLKELGADVTTVHIYDVVQNINDDLAAEIEQINLSKPDIFIFTSPSSFENFCSIMNIDNTTSFFDRSIICVIGTTTEKTIRQKDLAVHIVPNTFSLTGVAEAIIKYFRITATIA
jgi:uroporphyrinogen-III synthase